MNYPDRGQSTSRIGPFHTVTPARDGLARGGAAVTVVPIAERPRPERLGNEESQYIAWFAHELGRGDPIETRVEFKGGTASVTPSTRFVVSPPPRRFALVLRPPYLFRRMSQDRTD
jgi:hypothetical protein